MSTHVRIDNISKHYPPQGSGSSRRLTRAVDDVSLSIDPGQLFFLLGPSGCGKTTLLRMVAGFIDPTAGNIHFNERDVTPLPAGKRNTGMVFQSYALWPHMTVAQNVAFGLNVRKISKQETNTRVEQALAAVRMDEYASRKPNQLSGGQQQRVALARALVIRPEVLLLDEPLSNLDARLRTEMRSEIKRICSEAGITTLYVTHDQKEALSMADSMAVLSEGKVIQIGPPREIYAKPVNRFVAQFLGEAAIFPATIDADLARTPHGNLQIEADSTTNVQRNEALAIIRPEAWEIHPLTATPPNGSGGAGTNANTGIPAIIKEVRFMGEFTEFFLEPTLSPDQGKQAVFTAITLGPASAHNAGDKIIARANARDVVLVPRD